MKLFEPLAIRSMTLPNRIVMPAMATALFGTDGLVTGEAMAYYSRRAAGGVGLVTLEVTGIHRLSRHRRNVSMIDRDECIQGLSRLAGSIHAHGASFSIQLWHCGHIGDSTVLGEQPVAPSPIPPRGRKDPPRELTLAEIEDLVERFGEAARRAREAGADTVEIHAAHGYLITQFLSPLSNQRSDRYGGELRNRARFALEVTKRVREVVGPDYPVMAKLTASEHVDGGITIEETRTVARWMQEAGVDAFTISSGSRQAPIWSVPPMTHPRGCLVPFAAAVKSVVDVPVGAVGRINTPEVAEGILQEGQADFVAVGRGVIADPDFPRKAREGRSDEIRLCVACRHCLDRSKNSLQCMVNPEAGRELELPLEKAATPKRVMVVGGGPAGLEAARVAALRGHGVALYEQASSLGGMAAVGSRPPSKGELKAVVDHYVGELARRGVEIHLNRRVTAELVRESAPDVVVVATGSIPAVPPVSGIQQTNVVQARDVLADQGILSGSAVVVGGGSVGCETAEYLRAKGLEVTVLEMLDAFALDMEAGSRQELLHHLRSMGVEMIASMRVVRLEGRRVVCAGPGGKETAIEGDTIVLSVGARPDTGLLEELKSLEVPVMAVGDCVEPRRIHNAIYEGAVAGRRI